MEKKFKRVPFDLELARDIQRGKVEGRIVTNNGGETSTELPEAPKHDLKVGDKLRLVCPKCLKSFDKCKSWPAYHNRIDYECPHCGYTDDSVEFETCYSWHPYNKTEKAEV